MTAAARAWAERIGLGALAVWGCVFAARFWDHKLLLGDEGAATLGALRILAGQVPGGDFFEIYPPASYLPSVIAFGLFGPTVASERGVVLLLAALLAFLADRTLVQTGAPPAARAFALAVLIPFGVLYWPVPSHHWWVDVLQMGSALALMKVPFSKRPVRLCLISGALAGLALFSLQDQGLLFLVALGGLFWFPARRESWFRRSLAAWWSGLGCAAVPFLSWLLPTAGWKNLALGWVVFPFTGYRGVPGNRFNPLAGWEEIGAIWTTGAWTGAPVYSALLTGCAVTLLLLPLVAAIALVAAWWGRRSERLRVGILGALAVAFLGTALHRWALTNAVWAAPGLLVALGASFLGGGGRVASVFKAASPRVLALTALLFFAFSASLYRLGAAPAPVETRAGVLRSLARGEARDLDQVLRAVERWVPPGAPLFCVGFHSMVNFLSQRPNPTRYNVFIRPAYNYRWQSEEVAQQLAAGGVRWVCADRTRIPPADDPTGKVLRERFAPRFQNPRFLLLERVDPKAGGVPK